MYSGKLYTPEEREAIVKYIIDHHKYYVLKGNLVWKEIEQQQICPGRTWQSMKNHFKTQIVNSIKYFKIPDKEKDRIINGYYNIGNNSELKKPHTEASCSGKNTVKEVDLQKRPREEELNEENLRKCAKITTLCEERKDEAAVTIDDNIEKEPEQHYSKEDDCKIIQFIKENMNWNSLQFEDDLYRKLASKFSFNSSEQSIRHRFLTVILPNLYKYDCLSMGEMINFYDRGDVEMPKELLQKIKDSSVPKSSKSKWIRLNPFTQACMQPQKGNSKSELQPRKSALSTTDTEVISASGWINTRKPENVFKQIDSNVNLPNKDDRTKITAAVTKTAPVKYETILRDSSTEVSEDCKRRLTKEALANKPTCELTNARKCEKKLKEGEETTATKDSMLFNVFAVAKNSQLQDNVISQYSNNVLSSKSEFTKKVDTEFEPKIETAQTFGQFPPFKEEELIEEANINSANSVTTVDEKSSEISPSSPSKTEHILSHQETTTAENVAVNQRSCKFLSSKARTYMKAAKRNPSIESVVEEHSGEDLATQNVVLHDFSALQQSSPNKSENNQSSIRFLLNTVKELFKKANVKSAELRTDTEDIPPSFRSRNTVEELSDYRRTKPEQSEAVQHLPRHETEARDRSSKFLLSRVEEPTEKAVTEFASRKIMKESRNENFVTQNLALLDSSTKPDAAQHLAYREIEIKDSSSRFLSNSAEEPTKKAGKESTEYQTITEIPSDDESSSEDVQVSPTKSDTVKHLSRHGSKAAELAVSNQPNNELTLPKNFVSFQKFEASVPREVSTKDRETLADSAEDNSLIFLSKTPSSSYVRVNYKQQYACVPSSEYSQVMEYIKENAGIKPQNIRSVSAKDYEILQLYENLNSLFQNLVNDSIKMCKSRQAMGRRLITNFTGKYIIPVDRKHKKRNVDCLQIKTKQCSEVTSVANNTIICGLPSTSKKAGPSVNSFDTASDKDDIINQENVSSPETDIWKNPEMGPKKEKTKNQNMDNKEDIQSDSSEQNSEVVLEKGKAKNRNYRRIISVIGSSKQTDVRPEKKIQTNVRNCQDESSTDSSESMEKRRGTKKITENWYGISTDSSDRNQEEEPEKGKMSGVENYENNSLTNSSQRNLQKEIEESRAKNSDIENQEDTLTDSEQSLEMQQKLQKSRNKYVEDLEEVSLSESSEHNTEMRPKIGTTKVEQKDNLTDLVKENLKEEQEKQKAKRRSMNEAEPQKHRTRMKYVESNEDSSSTDSSEDNLEMSHTKLKLKQRNMNENEGITSTYSLRQKLKIVRQKHRTRKKNVESNEDTSSTDSSEKNAAVKYTRVKVRQRNVNEVKRITLADSLQKKSKIELQKHRTRTENVESSEDSSSTDSSEENLEMSLTNLKAKQRNVNKVEEVTSTDSLRQKSKIKLHKYRTRNTNIESSEDSFSTDFSEENVTVKHEKLKAKQNKDISLNRSPETKQKNWSVPREVKDLWQINVESKLRNGKKRIKHFHEQFSATSSQQEDELWSKTPECFVVLNKDNCLSSFSSCTIRSHDTENLNQAALDSNSSSEVKNYENGTKVVPVKKGRRGRKPKFLRKNTENLERISLNSKNSSEVKKYESGTEVHVKEEKRKGRRGRKPKILKLEEVKLTNLRAKNSSAMRNNYKNINLKSHSKQSNLYRNNSQKLESSQRSAVKFLNTDAKNPQLNSGNTLKSKRINSGTAKKFSSDCITAKSESEASDVNSSSSSEVEQINSNSKNKSALRKSSSTFTSEELQQSESAKETDLNSKSNAKMKKICSDTTEEPKNIEHPSLHPKSNSEMKKTATDLKESELQSKMGLKKCFVVIESADLQKMKKVQVSKSILSASGKSSSNENELSPVIPHFNRQVWMKDNLNVHSDRNEENTVVAATSSENSTASFSVHENSSLSHSETNVQKARKLFKACIKNVLNNSELFAVHTNIGNCTRVDLNHKQNISTSSKKGNSPPADSQNNLRTSGKLPKISDENTVFPSIKEAVIAENASSSTEKNLSHTQNNSPCVKKNNNNINRPQTTSVDAQNNLCKSGRSLKTSDNSSPVNNSKITTALESRSYQTKNCHNDQKDNSSSSKRAKSPPLEPEQNVQAPGSCSETGVENNLRGNSEIVTVPKNTTTVIQTEFNLTQSNSSLQKRAESSILRNMLTLVRAENTDKHSSKTVTVLDSASSLIQIDLTNEQDNSTNLENNLEYNSQKITASKNTSSLIQAQNNSPSKNADAQKTVRKPGNTYMITTNFDDEINIGGNRNSVKTKTCSIPSTLEENSESLDTQHFDNNSVKKEVKLESFSDEETVILESESELSYQCLDFSPETQISPRKKKNIGTFSNKGTENSVSSERIRRSNVDEVKNESCIAGSDHLYLSSQKNSSISPVIPFNDEIRMTISDIHGDADLEVAVLDNIDVKTEPIFEDEELLLENFKNIVVKLTGGSESNCLILKEEEDAESPHVSDSMSDQSRITSRREVEDDSIIISLEAPNLNKISRETLLNKLKNEICRKLDTIFSDNNDKSTPVLSIKHISETEARSNIIQNFNAFGATNPTTSSDCSDGVIPLVELKCKVLNNESSRSCKMAQINRPNDFSTSEGGKDVENATILDYFVNDGSEEFPFCVLSQQDNSNEDTLTEQNSSESTKNSDESSEKALNTEDYIDLLFADVPSNVGNKDRKRKAKEMQGNTTSGSDNIFAGASKKIKIRENTKLIRPNPSSDNILNEPSALECIDNPNSVNGKITVDDPSTLRGRKIYKVTKISSKSIMNTPSTLELRKANQRIKHRKNTHFPGKTVRNTSSIQSVTSGEKVLGEPSVLRTDNPNFINARTTVDMLSSLGHRSVNKKVETSSKTSTVTGQSSLELKKVNEGMQDSFHASVLLNTPAKIVKPSTSRCFREETKALELTRNSSFSDNRIDRDAPSTSGLNKANVAVKPKNYFLDKTTSFFNKRLDSTDPNKEIGQNSSTDPGVPSVSECEEMKNTTQNNLEFSEGSENSVPDPGTNIVLYKTVRKYNKNMKSVALSKKSRLVVDAKNVNISHLNFDQHVTKNRLGNNSIKDKTNVNKQVHFTLHDSQILLPDQDSRSNVAVNNDTASIDVAQNVGSISLNPEDINSEIFHDHYYVYE